MPQEIFLSFKPFNGLYTRHFTPDIQPHAFMFPSFRNYNFTLEICGEVIERNGALKPTHAKDGRVEVEQINSGKRETNY